VGRDSDSLRTGRSGIEFRWRRDFPHPSRPALGPTKPPKQWVPGLPGGEVAGVWRWPPPPHLAPRLEKGQSYTSTPLWAFVASSKVSFTFTLFLPLPLWTCRRASGSQWHLRRVRFYKFVTSIREICSYWTQNESQAYCLLYTLNRIRAFIDSMCMSCRSMDQR
jgi:hypothetical protein